MATGGATFLPSKEKTNFLRLFALVTDVGTLALKTQFDIVFPPLTLGQDLRALVNYRILNRLKSQKIISQSQFDLLFPPPTKVADSSDFDISIFSCLIQNLPALGQHTSQVWTQPGPPAPTDFSLAAEVKRLRNLRNYVAHQPKTTLTDPEFQNKWQETSDIIQRLCGTLPGIQNIIADYLNLSMDPEKEKKYIDRLQQWKDYELRLEMQEKQVAEIHQDLQEQKEKIETNKTDIVEISRNLIKFTDDYSSLKEDVKDTTAKTETLSQNLEKQIKRTDAIQADQDMRSKMSSEYRALVSRSKNYFKEKERIEFIETATYTKAREILNTKKIVILSGHPGEGKTTMAKHLLLTQFSSERVINLKEPSDWKHVDFSLNLIDAILIDDIFGSGVLDENLVKKWERKLDDLSNAIKEKNISVVITSRHYILEETKQLFRSLPLFKKENTQLLSSKDLTNDEKLKILEVHLKAEKRPIENDKMLLCVLQHVSVIENLFGTDEFLFGFPQCVDLFARQKDLFDMGPDFFSQPNIFMKNCIKQLYENEEKFLALIVMWANEGQILKKSDLDESNLSHRVTKIAKRFKFKMKGKLIKRLRKSLDYHVDGLLHFSKESGIYSFNHNVICDMVGLVIAEENPDEILEFCTRGFLLTYVTTQSTEDEFKFCVDEYLFKDLANRFLELMVDEKTMEGLLDCGVSILTLNRGGKMKSSVKPTLAFDFNIVKHKSFQHKEFVDVFLTVLDEQGKLESLFSTEIMEISGYFLRYGLKIDEQKFYLLSYSAFIGAEMFAQRVIARNLLDRTKLSKNDVVMEYNMTLFFAIHHQMLELVKILLNKGAFVSEEALYIAAHKANKDVLMLILRHPHRQKLQNAKILNRNNALIVAAKKGFADAVKCFIDCGYDLTKRNKDGLSALDKAVAFGREDVCELLVKAGVPINTPTRKFKRTPIHTAVDKGLIAATKCLLEKGANLRTRDHKGFYPIHAAALNKHLEIVHLLLEHDPSQASIKTKTYGQKSKLKGKTVFHIAAYRKEYELLAVLLSTKANPNVTDLDGRTVFLEAILSGDLDLINILKNVSDMSIPDKNGFTPLHVSVYKGYISLVHLICSNSAVNVNAKDKYGETPLHVSVMKGFSDIFLALAFMYKADWRMVTNRGDSTMHLAVRAREKFSMLSDIEDLINRAKRADYALDECQEEQHVSSVTSTDNECAEINPPPDTTNESSSLREGELFNKSAFDDETAVKKTFVSSSEQCHQPNNDNCTAGALIYSRNGVENTYQSVETNSQSPDVMSSPQEGETVLESTSDDGTPVEKNIASNQGSEADFQPLDTENESADDRYNLINSIVNHLITNAQENTADLQNTTQTRGNMNNGENDICALTKCKTTLQDYNIIVNVLAIFDEEFLKRELTNKYGQKIVFNM